MDLKTLLDTPPWDWPEGAGKMFCGILRGERADESDRLVAAELAGDLIVINDELVDALLSIVRRGDQPEQMRARAAISLGPVLEQVETAFEIPDDAPITQRTFRRIKESLREFYLDGQRSEGSPATNSGGIGARPAGLALGGDPGRLLQRRQSVEADRCLFDALGSRFRRSDP